MGRKPIHFDLTPSFKLGYLCGLVAGDGNLNKHQHNYRIRFRSTKKDFIYKIITFLNINFPELNVYYDTELECYKNDKSIRKV